MGESRDYAYFEDINWGLLRLWGDRSGLDVLDVGCGFATTSEHIQKRGNRVTGIESSEEAVARASHRIDTVIHADLLDHGAISTGKQFDVILFADVLEHLPWPLAVLQRYLQLLRENGTVIVSLPNVGLWSVRLSLMAGRFDYADTGVLDRTHLRFFTRRTARKLLGDAGLAPIRTTYNPGIARPFVPLAKRLLAKREGDHDPAALLQSKPYRAYLKTVYPLETVAARMWPGLLAFQMIIEAGRKQG
ncbi:MAG TPA: class I SAM-dependent methyltransferase [Thermoanaerobaculia bacterium]|nr:class I SAM-dependent methyltransferase [Thermoanaerobaculia bacterium]